MAIEQISLEADAVEYAKRDLPRDIAGMSAEIRELALRTILREAVRLRCRICEFAHRRDSNGRVGRFAPWHTA